MKAWRVPVIAAMIVGSLLAVFCAGNIVKTPVYQVLIFLLSLNVSLLAVCLAQDDGRIRGIKPEEPKPCPDCGWCPEERSIFDKPQSEQPMKGKAEGEE